MRYLLSILVLCIGTVNAQTNCDTYPKDYVPKDIVDAVTYLACTWSKADKDSFKIVPERQAVARLHFGTGLYIRNGWDLWKGENDLVDYFKSVGIFHPDDMSSIILTSFHRFLNDKEIDLDEQVKYYQDYWDKVQVEKDQHNKIYRTIKTGDTVRVMFSKFQATSTTYSLAFLNYTAPIENNNRCFVSGVVLDKQRKKGSRILTIQIIQTTSCDNTHLGDISMTAGQKFKYNMTYFNVFLIKNTAANKGIANSGVGH